MLRRSRLGRWRTASPTRKEAVMAVIIYGDFNCPYSYLASQRAGLLSRLGITEWSGGPSSTTAACR